jgi:hypothetical protein
MSDIYNQSGSVNFQYKTGIANVGNYQISGIPFITGGVCNGAVGGAAASENKITFPYVMKQFTIINKGTQPLWIHFASRANADVTGGYHYISLENKDDSMKFTTRTTTVYLSTSGSYNTMWQLWGEVTSIAAQEMNMLSGSGINTP